MHKIVSYMKSFKAEKPENEILTRPYFSPFVVISILGR